MSRSKIKAIQIFSCDLLPNQNELIKRNFGLEFWIGIWNRNGNLESESGIGIGIWSWNLELESVIGICNQNWNLQLESVIGICNRNL